jgi:hypothetical protein
LSPNLASRRHSIQDYFARSGLASGRGVQSAARSSEQRLAYASHGRLDIAHDERRIQPEHAISRASQHRITSLISPHPLGVIAAINLDHKPPRGRIEIRDEAPKQRHVPAKHHAQPPPANTSPEQRFGRRQRTPHPPSTLVEHRDPCSTSIAKYGLVVGWSHARHWRSLAQAPCQPPAVSRRPRRGWHAACALSHDSNRRQARALVECS